MTRHAGGTAAPLAYHAPPAPRRALVMAAAVAAVVFGLMGFVAGVMTLYDALPGQWRYLWRGMPPMHRLSLWANLAYMLIRALCCGVMLAAGLWVLTRRRGASRLLVTYVVLEFVGQLVSMLPPAVALASAGTSVRVWPHWLIQVGYVGSTALLLGLVVVLLRTRAVREAIDRAAGIIPERS